MLSNVNLCIVIVHPIIFFIFQYFKFHPVAIDIFIHDYIFFLKTYHFRYWTDSTWKHIAIKFESSRGQFILDYVRGLIHFGSYHIIFWARNHSQNLGSSFVSLSARFVLPVSYAVCTIPAACASHVR